MNKKGFTLVEILAVIVILAILMTVAGTSVFGIIHESQQQLLDEQVKNLGDTAITYMESKKYYFDKCPVTFDPKNPNVSLKNHCYREVSVLELVESGLFENKKDLCDTTKSILVYKKQIANTSGGYVEFASFVPEDTCRY